MSDDPVETIYSEDKKRRVVIFRRGSGTFGYREEYHYNNELAQVEGWASLGGRACYYEDVRKCQTRDGGQCHLARQSQGRQLTRVLHWTPGARSVCMSMVTGRAPVRASVRQRISVALPLEQIERFFEARFEAMEPGPGSVMHHFDGFAHWSVIYTQHFLYISADDQIGGSSFPVVELTLDCERVSISSAGGVGPTLTLHPNDSDEKGRLVVLTKTKQGRISLCVCVGAEPESRQAEPGTSPNAAPPHR